jgi:hypothetical protein
MPFLIISFIFFPADQADSVTIRKFVKAGNFATLLDTIFFDRSISSYQTMGDPLELGFAHGQEIGLVNEYDYQVVLPPTDRLYQLTEITEEPLTIRAGLMDKTGCMNTVKSYRVGGQLITGDCNYRSVYFKL